MVAQKVVENVLGKKYNGHGREQVVDEMLRGSEKKKEDVVRNII